MRLKFQIGDRVQGLMWIDKTKKVWSQPFIIARITHGEDGTIYWSPSDGRLISSGWSEVKFTSRKVK